MSSLKPLNQPRFECLVVCVCVVNNHPEEFLRVFDEEGHAVVQFLQIVFQVTGCHLERDGTEKRLKLHSEIFDHYHTFKFHQQLTIDMLLWE